MCAHLGKIMDSKILWKDQRPWGGAGSKSRVLHLYAAHSATEQVGRPRKPPLWPDPWAHPILTLFKKPAHPILES